MINFNKIKKKLICAEIGLSHHGSIKKTKKIIDKISLTGADIVKFQTHIAEHDLHMMKSLEKGLISSQKRVMIIGKKVNLQIAVVQIKNYCTKKSIF